MIPQSFRFLQTTPNSFHPRQNNPFLLINVLPSSLMEPFIRRVSDRWPVIAQAATWTVLLMFTVAVASFAPEMAFVSTVSSSCDGRDGFVKIPMVIPGESVCVPSHMVKRSRFDLLVPSLFAAVMVTASACLIRSCIGTENVEEI